MLTDYEKRIILQTAGSSTSRRLRKIKCDVVTVWGSFQAPRFESQNGKTVCVVGIGWCCQNL